MVPTTLIGNEKTDREEGTMLCWSAFIITVFLRWTTPSRLSPRAGPPGGAEVSTQGLPQREGGLDEGIGRRVPGLRYR